MKPVMQTRLSNPEGTIHGNCFTACVASIVELPMDQVPDMQEGDGKWFDPFFEVITTAGLEYHGHRNRWNYMGEGKPREEHEDFFRELESFEGVDGFVIVDGTSFRDYVTRGHACIYKGGKLAHDPHPSGLGIKDVTGFLLLTKVEPQK